MADNISMFVILLKVLPLFFNKDFLIKGFNHEL